MTVRQFENVTTGVTWEPARTVRGADMTVLRSGETPFVPGASYVLRAIVADVFVGLIGTAVDIRFSTK